MVLKVRTGALVAVVVAILSLGSGIALADTPVGTWVMSNGKVTVRLSKCSSKLCARIVGLSEPLDKEGRPKVDRLNPDPALRNRRLIGLTLAGNLTQRGPDTWVGSIYSPDDGLTYGAVLKINGSGMQVQGCVAGLMCKTHSFRRH
jgi:uncharacterized protein (DUF2147 family)